jgi:phage terminase large subunit
MAWGISEEFSESRVFKNWRVEECEPAPGTIFRLGGDFGFATDPTAALRCWIEGNNIYVDYEAWSLACEIIDTPDLFFQIPEAEDWPFVADSSRPETISHLRKHGFPKILSAVKGPNSVVEGIKFLQGYTIIVHPAMYPPDR